MKTNKCVLMFRALMLNQTRQMEVKCGCGELEEVSGIGVWAVSQIRSALAQLDNSVYFIFNVYKLSLDHGPQLTAAHWATQLSPSLSLILSLQLSFVRLSPSSGHHQPAHQDEPWGTVIEGVLPITEDVRALLGPSIWAGVIHESLIIHEVLHLALPFISQLGNLRITGGEGGRGRAVGQMLVHTAVENRWAKKRCVGRMQAQQQFMTYI